MGLGCDDEAYCLVKSDYLPFADQASQEPYRDALRRQEKRVLQQLYKARPLCRAEFDYQSSELLRAHGPARFCHHAGNPRGWSLMIDEARLVAVGPEDVRSQYGYYCESDEALDEQQAESRVMAWLASGEGYDDYRSKTTCRYC
jgi:hypothetical protein